jgi:hypothetical protein
MIVQALRRTRELAFADWYCPCIKNEQEDLFGKGGTMGGIFISYRREDSSGWTGRLAERLKARLGEKSIFMDLDGIELGIDFTIALHKALESCDVLLAMIGPEWVTATDETGKRRLDDPTDWVRTEIATALKRNIRVIPVLVGGADVPTQNQLPDDLDPLAHRQAYELTDKRWNYDVEQLINAFPTSLRKPWLLPNIQLWQSTPVVMGVLVITLLLSVWVVFTSLYAPLPDSANVSNNLSPEIGWPQNPGSSRNTVAPPAVQKGGKIELITATTIPHSDSIEPSIALRVGQEARLKDHVTSCAYKVLAAQIERSRPDLSLLRMIVRVTNEGSMTTNFGDGNFRLLVDNVPRAPTSNLNDLVDAHSAKESTIVFAVPVNATRFVLQFLMGEEKATFPL